MNDLTDSRRELLRRIPALDSLLQLPEVVSLCERYGRTRVTQALRGRTDELRSRILTLDPGDPSSAEIAPTEIAAASAARLEAEGRPTLRRAINATGIIVHTGLGRSLLSAAAAKAVQEVSESHSLLEIDPETGERGSRQAHIAPLLCEQTGAEAALAVNNNAAAVFLAISTLAAGREVIIARGQLVEIGGSFRIPDVIRSAGARLVEVGTTNRVRLRDYEAAVTAETALILRVHPSNFKIVGFTAEASLEELAGLGRKTGLPVMDDQGSGALVPVARLGLPDEPTAGESIAAGCDVVTFSGDKLLGGPQAGLIVGRMALLDRMALHPLMRVVRCDRLTLAALSATLRLYRDEEQALREIPTLNALARSSTEVEEMAHRLFSHLEGADADLDLQPSQSQVGGGALPGVDIPTMLVAVNPHTCSPGELARRLRMGTPSVWARVQHDRLLLDPRTLRPGEIEEVAGAIARAMAPPEKQ